VRTALLTGVLALLAYWSTLQLPLSGDASAHIYTAFSFVHEGDADLDEYASTVPPLGAFTVEIAGHRYAPYLPGNALVFAPVAALAALAGVARACADPRLASGVAGGRDGAGNDPVPMVLGRLGPRAHGSRPRRSTRRLVGIGGG
jgi:hypothetical protein